MRTINVGIFLPNWVGDVVMATPTLRALRQHFGDQARMIGVMRPYVADVLSGTNWLDGMIPFDRRAADPRLHSSSVVRQLRLRHVDAVVLMTNSLRAAWMAVRGRIPRRVGYVRYGRGPLLTDRLRPPRAGWRLTPVSAVDYYLQLANAMGAATDSRQLQLGTTAIDDRHADEIWSQFGVRPSDTVVALNSGGAYGSAKEWPVEHFATLARRLARQEETKVVIICGPIERPIAARIAKLADSPGVHSLADQAVSLGLSKSLIKRSHLLISTDSGPRHFGAAFGVPTVTLFGPTDPRWSHNYHPHSIDLQQPMPCGPCAKRQCPLQHHRCMRELSVERVYEAAMQLLRPRLERAA
jgi:heptosyltransferase-2